MKMAMTANKPARAEVRPHDLLWISDPGALVIEGHMPAWAVSTMHQMSVVVVRRAACSDPDRVPVGLRGFNREERLAATVPIGCVEKIVSPEDLVRQPRWSFRPRSPGKKAVSTLEMVMIRWKRYRLEDKPVVWGPGGSVGFELATGFPAMNEKSDLDLVLRAPCPLPQAMAASLLDDLEGLPARVDVQMETPFGCVALYEYARSTAPRILLRTSSGPKLVKNPWSPEQGEIQ